MIFGGRENKVNFYFNDIFFLNLMTLDWIKVEVIGETCEGRYIF